MESFAPMFVGVNAAIAAAPVDAGAFAALDDAALLATPGQIAQMRRALDLWAAWAAGELARRSRPGLGGQSLARRAGHADPVALLQSTTGASRRDARALLKIGTMMGETDAAAEHDRLRESDPEAAAVIPPAERPWHALLGEAVAAGTVSVPLADAIRTGLGEPGGRVTAEALAGVLPEVIVECAGVHVDAALKAARRWRDRLDVAGVAERAEAQRSRQYWRMWEKPDGMFRGEFELAPDAGALLKSVHDQLVRPFRTAKKADACEDVVDELAERRASGDADTMNAAGGVVDAAARRAKRAFGDPPPPNRGYYDRVAKEREAADGLVQLIRAGASVDPGKLLDGQKPAVKILVNGQSLADGFGYGQIEGTGTAIPLHDVESGVCAGYLPIVLDDDGQVLNRGREERLFTPAQKAVLAARDGGCLDPECDRPPSWTEAHHIDHWKRDRGRTDLADGVLLCRRDHLRYHNEGWEIRRDGGRYWLIPPPVIDPEQTPRPMRPKTRAEILNPVMLDPALIAVIDRARAPAADEPPLRHAG